MTISPIAFATTRYQFDVYNWAKKLTILEFGMEIIFYLIALFYFRCDFTWWGFGIEVVFLASLVLEYYGIDEKKVGFIIFSCFARLFWTWSYFIFTTFEAFVYFHDGGSLEPNW